MAKILVVEDDSDLMEPLVRSCVKDGHLVETAMSGKDALQMLEGYKFDVVILDWGLPDLSGLDVVKRFRSSGGITPIIFLTGRDDLASKKDGLDAGADDYLAKPFEIEELFARIRAVLRRPIGLLPSSMVIGNVRLEADTKSVYSDGAFVRLGKKEYSVLEFLMRHPNRRISSQELMEAVWPSDTDSDVDAVRSCVRQLRAKITSKNGTCIVATVPGGGYTIAAE